MDSVLSVTSKEYRTTYCFWLLSLLEELANKFKSCGNKSKDSWQPSNMSGDASTDQRTNTLLAAYDSESIDTKAGDLIKNCSLS